MATMADVARRADVSISTVSYALSGARPVSEETRRRIEAAMEDLGFEPNVLARGLARARSNIIALVFPEGDHGIDLTGIEILMAAANRARRRGYHALLWTDDTDVTEAAPRLARQGLVDGVLMLEIRTVDDRVAALRSAGIPFALIGMTGDHSDVPFVETDVEQMTITAVRHLHETGHEVIGYVGVERADTDQGSSLTNRVVEGMLAAGERFGVRIHPFICEPTPAAGVRAVHSFARIRPRITAVVGMNEPATAGVLAGAAEIGWQVPDELSVVALMSSCRAAEMAHPQLTTVSPEPGRLGECGVDVLIDRLEGGSRGTRQVFVPTRLTVRGSSRPRKRA